MSEIIAKAVAYTSKEHSEVEGQFSIPDSLSILLPKRGYKGIFDFLDHCSTMQMMPLHVTFFESHRKGNKHSSTDLGWRLEMDRHGF